MERLDIEEIAHSCGAIPFNCDGIEYISGIATDSRKLQNGDLFVALKGENFDGHEFAASAVRSGAAVVLSQQKLSYEIPYLLVKDTLKAMQDIARYYKNKFNIPIVAITGSSGKTTTKDMVASVLSQKYKVLKTEGNFNNAVGLPLTLFRLDSSHEICVLEMGMSSLGEIELLSDIVRPDIGVITNVGTAHIENLKSRENILKSKLEMFTYFNNENIAVINGDNDLLQSISGQTYKIIKFGIEINNDYRAEDIIEDDNGVSFSLAYKGEKEDYSVPIPGIHNVYNAMSAICIGKLFKLTAIEINAGLSKFKPSKNRMEIFQGINETKIINDAYNANPDSMLAAIQVLAGMETKGRRICIFGDMFELGDYEKEGHYRVGRYAAERNINVIIAVGRMSQEVINGASMAGRNNLKLFAFNDNLQAIENLKNIIKPQDVILVKGSRGMYMENIVDILREGRQYK